MTTSTRESLAERLQSGPLPVHDAVHICRSLLSAIESAHARGIAHGSINVAAIVLEGDRVLLGPSPVDAATSDTPASDVYAVGMVMYETVSGRGWSPDFWSRRAEWSGVPRPLRGVLRKALDPRPERRWPDVSAFQRALWVPRPQEPIWPAILVLVVAAVVIAAVVLCKPLGLCRERTAGPPGAAGAEAR